MSKIKSTLKSKISNWIAPYNENKEVFSSDGKSAFVAANIPLYKLGNHVLKSFLEKRAGKSIPYESTLRKNYIPRKKTLLKAPSRINKYRNEMPGLPLPPEPIITRWEALLNAALFYANNFEEFKIVIASLTDDATSVEKLKQLVQHNAVKCGLAFIKLHLSELSINLKHLKESNSELLKSMDIFRKIDDILTNIPGPNGKKIKEKSRTSGPEAEEPDVLSSYRDLEMADRYGNEPVADGWATTIG
ncbi:Hypothetical protein CINCED_3A022669 [Cinara cedri]|uniref:Uncharacterized protein n=1 Tax=Cinara cedri TaxID=506608 RepID=A0A5E4N606_9HEMI|nr:Hypothetical protein CINCED_3A022669 [Cinara cedri]